MSRALQYPLAIAGGVLVVSIGLLVLIGGGATYSSFGWLLIAVSALLTAANVLVRWQRRAVTTTALESTTHRHPRAGSS